MGQPSCVRCMPNEIERPPSSRASVSPRRLKAPKRGIPAQTLSFLACGLRFSGLEATSILELKLVVARTTGARTPRDSALVRRLDVEATAQ